MDMGDIYRAGSSLRGGGSNSFWRNGNTLDVFSRSSRGEDDEEALKWAALEKLPTFDRLRKGILTTPGVGPSEVDIHNLGFREKQQLIERLVKVAETDNEKFLLKLKDRIDRVGIELPKIEVRFEHVNVEGETYVGSRALPSFINFFYNVIEDFLTSANILKSRKKHLQILKDVSGIIRPGRMTLLLGPPASGKTTLLLALAGKLDSSLQSSGRVTYNGHEMDEFVPQRTAAYIGQHDVHIGEMTVRETLAFSARFQGVGTRYDMLSELSRREKAANIKPDPDIDVFMKAAVTPGEEASVVTDYILKILGLEVCADTLVGDEMVRGISGGQKKRVTTGEMLVGPANALFMDEISTGLDSSTTFQIVNCIRQIIHIIDGTALISLLQPAPETYDLFDDIIVLSEGQIVYQGPREHVLEFFESIGFKCPERKGVADFLQEVCANGGLFKCLFPLFIYNWTCKVSYWIFINIKGFQVTSRKDQQQYWTSKDEPYRFITVKEFSDAFQSFHVGRKLGDDLGTPFDKRKSHPAALTTKAYGVNKMELFKACFSREFLLMKRNSFVYYFKLGQLSVMACVAMTLFFRTKMHRDTDVDGIIYTGALFFAAMMIMFNGMSEISMTIVKLPVFYKQRDLRFYPSWAYALPTWILKIPVAFVEAAVWAFITYYVIGFEPNVGRFAKQFILLVFLNQMASGLFRLIAAAGRTMVIANTYGSYSLLLLVALGGFIISRKDVKDWWIWAYWCSPLMYAQNALVVNEFLGHGWKKIVPTYSTEPLGVAVMKSRGFFPYSYWYWIGAGALLGFTLLFNFGYTLALTFLNPFGKPQAVLPVESESNEHDNRSGGAIQLTTNASSFSHSPHSETTEQSDHQKKKGMVLPFQPHSITFDEISYSVDMPKEMTFQGLVEDKLLLLNGLSGAFRPGVLTALMGVSGAGKTTLMDVLAGRKTGGYIEGTITISGYPKKQETFARISGYCEQNDIHSPYVTVHESLVYSAWLRLPPEVDSETRKMFIEEVMELVELNTLRQGLVGLPGINGLSTEQRKRLTIAVELVANPSIIFMDEPTSGLDARAAAIVMRTVRNTVDTGRTVVCTIHQPSIDIFEAFDELFLLKRGGQAIYAGPLGRHSSLLIKYFEGIQGVPKIKDGHNPAAWMLEVTTESQEIALGVDFAEIFKISELYQRNKSLIRDLSRPAPGSKDLYFPTRYSQSFFTQCLACLWKQRWSYWRNTSYTAVRFLFTFFIALTFGTMFWDMGTKTSKRQDLFNAMGSIYAAVLFLGVQNATAVQPIVSVERTVFYREKAAGMYSAMSYAFAQVVVEIPYIFAQCVVYGIIVYAMIQFDWDAGKFFWYFFHMFLCLMYFTFYGMMAVAMTPNQHIAAVVAFSLYSIWSLFSGFIVPRTRIPVWWRWYFWGCPISWTLYGLVASQFGDIEDKLDTGETVKQFLDDYFGYKHDFLGVVVVGVIVFTVLFAFAFALGIKMLNFQKR
ncbi:pleiotropic drug resistance protein 1-like isoform X2 [Mangifera indica]|uniref:pleiotropic drug resistance protein 1-like isoform X2 n=1 Tax=Mangifera indica TaxID=29780 RepID=UPI001CFA52D1|nr:pleiotropic drug resistance protein 1-like isoform X2 [Mangifera indica]